MHRSPRVVDFSTHFSGPIASRQLTQLGADVVKIEAPNVGDGNRGVPPVVDGESPFHSYINAGTRSVVADTRSEGWSDLVAAAARWADVVIVGNRPESAQRRGIDFESIRAVNPKIVYCQITGYGLDGEWAGYPAHGLQMDVLAGVVPVEWVESRPMPLESTRSVGTTMAGIEAALGIYAALHRRDLSDASQYVHVSVWESALSWMWRDLVVHGVTGGQWDNYRDLGPRYRMYRTADDAVMLICPIERHFWERFCDVVGMSAEARARGDWSTGLDYGTDDDGESEEIARCLGTRRLDDWVETLIAHDVPVAAVLDWREAYASPHAAANGVKATFEYQGGPFTIPTTPVSVTSFGADQPAGLAALGAAHRAKGDHLGAPPLLGEHTKEVLEEFGVPDLASRLTRTSS